MTHANHSVGRGAPSFPHGGECTAMPRRPLAFSAPVGRAS